jgi:hypothetical protein
MTDLITEKCSQSPVKCSRNAHTKAQRTGVSVENWGFPVISRCTSWRVIQGVRHKVFQDRFISVRAQDETHQVPREQNRETKKLQDETFYALFLPSRAILTTINAYPPTLAPIEGIQLQRSFGPIRLILSGCVCIGERVVAHCVSTRVHFRRCR